MEKLLQRATTRKTLLYCVNGVHRSGNVACIIMCALDPTLTPDKAMKHLQKVRCISGPNERLPHKPQRMVGLSEWFDTGGPWTSRAPFLTAGPFLQRPSNFLCFPPTPTGPFVPSPTDSASRSPAGFPQAPRPRPSLFVRRRLASLPQSGHKDPRQQGNLFLSTHPPQTLLIGASRCRFPASDPCPFPPTPALSHAPPAEPPRRRHIPDAFPSAPVPNLPLVIFHLQRTLLRQIPLVITVSDYQTLLIDELRRMTNSPAASTPRLRGVKNGRTA